MSQHTGLFVPAALAALFVVPAVALQDAPISSLEESLRRTLHALEALAGLGERIEGGEREAVDQLLAATEPAPDDGLDQGLVLAQLRGEVSTLEIELDALHAAAPGAIPGHTGVRPAQGTGPEIPTTTGLDEATRASLAVLVPRAPSPEAGAAGAPPDGGEPQLARGGMPTRSFEEPGYVADALRLAKAYYRQGRWDQALGLLEGRATDPEEAYWRARCLDKLGRFDEALAAYEALVADPQGGSHAQRAREDLEFLRWRRQFEARRESLRRQEDR